VNLDYEYGVTMPCVEYIFRLCVADTSAVGMLEYPTRVCYLCCRDFFKMSLFTLQNLITEPFPFKFKFQILV